MCLFSTLIFQNIQFGCYVAYDPKHMIILLISPISMKFNAEMDGDIAYQNR